MLSHERIAIQEGFQIVVGIDEAGRGPLAGPVVAAAVSLKNSEFNSRIRDSKKMTAKQRQVACQEILEKSYVGVGFGDHKLIDDINILKATFFAMNAAVKDLVSKLPQIEEGEGSGKRICLLVDGNLFQTDLPFRYKTIVKGDSLSLSIACASIIAKVTRDNLMEEYDRTFPEYGFKSHKGYPTLIHKAKIKEFGLSSIHRKTFKYW